MNEHETSSESNLVDALELSVGRIAQSARARADSDHESSLKHRVDLADERERHADRLASIERTRHDEIATADHTHDETTQEARRESGEKLAELEDAYETKRRRIIDSSTELNKIGDIGSPCLTPLRIWKFLLVVSVLTLPC